MIEARGPARVPVPDPQSVGMCISCAVLRGDRDSGADAHATAVPSSPRASHQFVQITRNATMPWQDRNLRRRDKIPVALERGYRCAILATAAGGSRSVGRRLPIDEAQDPRRSENLG
jgi:hypothetical protein